MKTDQFTPDSSWSGMSKYTDPGSQEPSVKYRYGYHHDWPDHRLTHMVFGKQMMMMIAHYLVSVGVAAVNVLVVDISQDGHRGCARRRGGGIEVVVEAEQRALGPGGGAASCHQYKQDLQSQVRVRYLGLLIMASYIINEDLNSIKSIS